MAHVLYSFRRCPYAMRARLALYAAGCSIELREVSLKDKPAQMLQISQDATVPVLQLEDGQVVQESLDIMYWAAAQPSPRFEPASAQGAQLIKRNDEFFKHWLDRYKYHVGYPQQSQESYRGHASEFLLELDGLLQHGANNLVPDDSFTDWAVFPFVRQFAMVDPTWFEQQPWRRLLAWFQRWQESQAFRAVMHKYVPWQAGAPAIYLATLP